MDILLKIEDTKVAYENLAGARKERIEAIQKNQEEITAIEGEMKKVEGSFGTLVQLAQEMGLIDSEGNIVKKEDESNGNITEGNSSSEQEG